jgi:hypothetical protein
MALASRSRRWSRSGLPAPPVYGRDCDDPGRRAANRGPGRLRHARAWRAAVAFPGGSASSTLAATLPAGYLMIVTAIDAPVPVELIWITACALPFAASKWALQRDLAVACHCQPPDLSAFS